MNTAPAVGALVESAQAGHTQVAWQNFANLAGKIGEDREVALGFAALLRLDPGYAEALPLAERVISGFRTDPGVIIPLSAALLRTAEQRPPDEPPFVKGPAHLAAGACQSCFETLGSAQRTNPEVGGYLQLNMADGLRMMGPEYDADALSAYQLALTIDDSRGAWWFHLGLLHKWRGRFREGLAANQKAFARLGPPRFSARAPEGALLSARAPEGALLSARAPEGALRPVLWNLAICATALGEGKLALEAWEKLGIKGELSQSGMPHVSGIPAMQVRVATMGEEIGQNDPLPAKAVTFEVLWVAPLSPCHGVIQTPTARKASVDYGDVVLWDGAPARLNEVDGQQVPVFPLLWILRPGDERRLRFVGMQKQRDSMRSLGESLDGLAQLVVFDKREVEGASQLFYGKLIVPAQTSLAELRSRWEKETHARPGLTVAIPKLYELLGDTPSAGKAHQAWGGIEKIAQRQGLLPSSSGR